MQSSEPLAAHRPSLGDRQGLCCCIKVIDIEVYIHDALFSPGLLIPKNTMCIKFLASENLQCISDFGFVTSLEDLAGPFLFSESFENLRQFLR